MTEEECNHDCASCSASGNCESEPIQKIAMRDGSSAKKIIGIISGKGGVGKSFTTSYLAVLLARLGFRVGILDADITGPSIPYSFGIVDKALGTEDGIFPAISKSGIKLISSNMLLDDQSDPIVWRGPMIGSLVEQFYQDVIWEELDFLLIDMPPGTGDVALTTFQKIPVDSLVLVSSPQGLVQMIVEKAAKMAEMMQIKIEAVVTNMSYVICPSCGEKIAIYGEDKSSVIAAAHGIELNASVPFDPKINLAVERGDIESLELPYLDKVAAGLAGSLE